MLEGKRIIVAPLNWGLGHAARCIPLIERLLLQGNTVAIASDGGSLALLEKTFPALPSFTLSAYDIHYRHRSMEWNMLSQGYKIWKASNAEHLEIEGIVASWQADVVISDNRFGAYSSSVHSIFLTHQLRIVTNNAITSMFATKMHHFLFRRFNEVWIPDHQGDESLAGQMSQLEIDKSTTYLGPLSRIKKMDVDKTIDILVVLSGPEPQRTYLEDVLLETLRNFGPKIKIHLVRGGCDSSIAKWDGLSVTTFADSTQMNQLLNSTRLVICRSGYTSMMDLDVLDVPAILIPTPGQYEQEYLARCAVSKEKYQTLSQDEVRVKLENCIRNTGIVPK